MIVYLHPKCSTCQKAVQFLQKNKISFESRDIVQTAPTLPELKRMLTYQQGNIKKLLNTSGLLYREMELSTKLKDMSEQEILTLLSQHGMLVKRPFLLGASVGLVGFKEAEWANLC